MYNYNRYSNVYKRFRSVVQKMAGSSGLGRNIVYYYYFRFKSEHFEQVTTLSKVRFIFPIYINFPLR